MSVLPPPATTGSSHPSRAYHRQPTAVRAFFPCVLLVLSVALVSPLAFAEKPEAPAAPPAAFFPPPKPMTEADMWQEAGKNMENIVRAVAWAELAFPDLRLQTPARVGDGVDALVLSWPVHVVGLMTRSGQQGAGGSLFLEPAFPTDHRAVRALAGARLWGADRRTGLAVVLEGGGLVATDGHGAFAGGGPAIGDLSAVVALVARRYFVSGAERWDFTLELSIPAYDLVELLGG
ncbi:MAG TPA: hypothetical protein VFZ53_17600 [Polyangiaceae bacterium]